MISRWSSFYSAEISSLGNTFLDTCVNKPRQLSRGPQITRCTLQFGRSNTARRRENRKHQNAIMQRRRSDSRNGWLCRPNKFLFLFLILLIFLTIQIMEEYCSRNISAKRYRWPFLLHGIRWKAYGLRKGTRMRSTHNQSIGQTLVDRVSWVARHARGRVEIYLANNLLLLARSYTMCGKSFQTAIICTERGR